VATLYVTHDQVEAMTMGDQVAVLNLGHLQQVDKPQVLYDHPDNLFVAAFIGSPSMNLYRGTVGEGAHSLELGSQEIDLPDAVAVAHPGLVKYAGREVVVGLRPEHLPIPLNGETGPTIEGDVELVEALGSELLVHFRIDAKQVVAEGAGADEEAELATFDAGVARVDPRAAVKPLERARFEVDTARMQFFDLDTDLAIWD
jgi:multiple sugar transport system ATP-binding protein